MRLTPSFDRRTKTPLDTTENHLPHEGQESLSLIENAPISKMYEYEHYNSFEAIPSLVARVACTQIEALLFT